MSPGSHEPIYDRSEPMLREKFHKEPDNGPNGPTERKRPNGVLNRLRPGYRQHQQKAPPDSITASLLAFSNSFSRASILASCRSTMDVSFSRVLTTLPHCFPWNSTRFK